MMRYIKYNVFLLVVSLLFGCKKEAVLNDCATPNINTPGTLPLQYSVNESASVQALTSSIYYTAISPQYTLQYNVNNDTVIDYYIDLDADQINDFKIALQRKQYIWCANPPSYAYGTVISISSMDSSNYISKGNGHILINDPYYPYYSPNTQLLDSGMVISNSVCQFNKHTEVLFDKAKALGMLIDFIGAKYIPIAFKNNHYGWIYVEGFDLFQGKIIIKGFAYNGTKNNFIKSGQVSAQ